jgi:hypothetical protein
MPSMIRFLAACVAVSLASLSPFILAGPASAQTYAPSYGQPVYLDGWGRPVGGTPLSEVESRPYVQTGQWADGSHARPYVHIPGRAPAYGGHRGYGYGYGSGYGSGYGADRRPYQGYRDDWGYQDDRPRPGRRGYVDRRGYGYDRGPDVYLHDR